MTGRQDNLRVVIVNHNGGPLLRRAVDSALAAEWPGGREVVVVDNASTDGSLEGLGSLDDVVVIHNASNTGFGANNLAFRDLLGEPDPVGLRPCTAVLLLNPDARLEPGTLVDLASALDQPSVGAVAPHIVFDRPFADIPIDAGAVTVHSVEADGLDVSRAVVPRGGAHRLPGAAGPIWLAEAGELLRVPHAGGPIRLEVTASGPARIAGRDATGRMAVELEPDDLAHHHLVQNAGSELGPYGEGRNRGFGDVDGEHEYPDRAPAWCGAAVLLRADYLRDVGGFEPSYFLYYEDIDLSRRGQARGWDIAYVRSARVEHRHSDSSAQGTRLVEVLQHRNRLITLVRNDSLRAATVAYLRALLTPLSLVASAIGNPGTAGARLRLARWRARSVIDAVGAFPAALRARRTLRG